MLIGIAVAGVTPACPHPVIVEGHFDARAPHLHVLVKADSDPHATANMLAQKYHFTILAIWTHAAHGFAIKDIDLALIPLLQCEPSVEILSFDAVTTIAHDS